MDKLIIIKELTKGKSIIRTLTNVHLAKLKIKGPGITDIGGTGTASHYRFLRIPLGSEVKTVNLNEEALRKKLKRTGFSHIRIKPVGVGPWTAAFFQIEPFTPRFIETLLIFICFTFDWVFSQIKPSIDFSQKFPLAYVFYCKK